MPGIKGAQQRLHMRRLTDGSLRSSTRNEQFATYNEQQAGVTDAGKHVI